jgi:transcriptional regulator with XRE-family HTH domain
VVLIPPERNFSVNVDMTYPPKTGPETEVEYTYLSKIENGYVIPSTGVLNRIAKYLDCDQDEPG